MAFAAVDRRQVRTRALARRRRPSAKLMDEFKVKRARAGRCVCRAAPNPRALLRKLWRCSARGALSILHQHGRSSAAVRMRRTRDQRAQDWARKTSTPSPTCTLRRSKTLRQARQDVYGCPASSQVSADAVPSSAGCRVARGDKGRFGRRSTGCASVRRRARDSRGCGEHVPRAVAAARTTCSCARARERSTACGSRTSRRVGSRVRLACRNNDHGVAGEHVCLGADPLHRRRARHLDARAPRGSEATPRSPSIVWRRVARGVDDRRRWRLARNGSEHPYGLSEGFADAVSMLGEQLHGGRSSTCVCVCEREREREGWGQRRVYTHALQAP